MMHFDNTDLERVCPPRSWFSLSRLHWIKHWCNSLPCHSFLYGVSLGEVQGGNANVRLLSPDTCHMLFSGGTFSGLLAEEVSRRHILYFSSEVNMELSAIFSWALSCSLPLKYFTNLSLHSFYFLALNTTWIVLFFLFFVLYITRENKFH